jgi:Replicase family/Primase C terminal 1 (PriCT-1)
MILNAEKTRFIKQLNAFVYCSNDIKAGISRKKQVNAITHNYIALNRTYKSYLAFDIDRRKSIYDWYDLDCPQPTIITHNKFSDHCQYLYELETPVICTRFAKRQPQQYFDAVHKGLNDKLKGDLGFSGFMIRNPLITTTPVTLDKKYCLAELAEYIKFDPRTAIKVNELGRNCTLFDSLRLEGYGLFKRNYTQEQLFNELKFIAYSINNSFDIQLSEKEVLNTVKSVSRWVSTKYVGNGLRRGIMKLSDTLSTKEKQKIAGKFSANAKSQNALKRVHAAIHRQWKTGNKDFLDIDINQMCKDSQVTRKTIKNWIYRT